ncbi:MAG: type II toxin-antitoxin system VapC family toxin [Actinomycetota bacterium]
MSLLYADTSAVLRAYFVDEPDHVCLAAMLLDGKEAVVTSELARIELASAIRGASRAGRLPGWRELLARIDADCGEDGPITLLALRPDVVLPAAYRLVLEHRLRTLDAIHVAVAVEECPILAEGGEVAFVTRDEHQAAAAGALGLALR